MPDFLLRNDSVVAAYPDEFVVILPMTDGYELEVGHIAERSGAGSNRFWVWAAPGANGREPTRDAAAKAFKAAWDVTNDKLAAMREQQEWTEWKYVLWDAGYKNKLGKGPLRCHCGEMFDPDDHEAIRSHIDHIKATNRGMRRQ